MVDRGYDVEFYLSVAGCLEDAGIDLDFLDARAVEFLEGGDDAGFLPGTGRTVDK